MTDQEQKFCRQIVLGMTPLQAAKNAGYVTPEKDGKKLLKQEHIQAYIASEQDKYRDSAGVTRHEVIDGMREAIDMAKSQADPQTMLLGYRELAKMTGLYAPEVRKVEVSVDGHVTVQQLENLSDAELVKLIRQPALLEGEATRVED